MEDHIYHGLSGLIIALTDLIAKLRIFIIKAKLKESKFEIKKMKKAHFPLGCIFPNLEFSLARYLGFYQFVWAIKG